MSRATPWTADATTIEASLESDASAGLEAAEAPDEIGEDIGEDIEQQLIFAGIVGIIDPPRDEARVAIAEARGAGIRVVTITGDHPRTAARIATELGVAFREAVRRTSVYARVAPEHKLRIVDALQADGSVSVFHHLFTNPLLWGAIALSALLQVAVIYVPFLNDAFDTAPLSPTDWLLCTAMASVVLWADEGRKWIVRRLDALCA